MASKRSRGRAGALDGALDGAPDDVPAWIAIPIRIVIIAGLLIFVCVGSIMIVCAKAMRWLWLAISDT